MQEVQEIAKRIKKMCEENGVTINKMLSDCGAGARTYYNMMAGSYPSIDKIIKIAEYFNVSVDYLLGREEKKMANWGDLKSSGTTWEDLYNADLAWKEMQLKLSSLLDMLETYNISMPDNTLKKLREIASDDIGSFAKSKKTKKTLKNIILTIIEKTLLLLNEEKVSSPDIDNNSQNEQIIYNICISEINIEADHYGQVKEYAIIESADELKFVAENLNTATQNTDEDADTISPFDLND